MCAAYMPPGTSRVLRHMFHDAHQHLESLHRQANIEMRRMQTFAGVAIELDRMHESADRTRVVSDAPYAGVVEMSRLN